jgi:hypothetical protein
VNDLECATTIAANDIASGDLRGLRKNLVWKLLEEGTSLLVPLNPLLFDIPNCFSGEESAFASFPQRASFPRRLLAVGGEGTRLHDFGIAQLEMLWY